MGVSFSQIAILPHAIIFTTFGTWRVFAPVSSMALLGMTVDANDLNLLNELSGNHALNMGFGLLAWLGIFLPSLRSKATAGCIYCPGMYLFGRVMSSILNGLPNEDIVNGMVTEFFLTALAVAAYLSETKKSTTKKDE